MIDWEDVYATKVGLKQAVEAELILSEGGAVNRALVMAGSLPAWDDCECGGQLTVHLANLYRTRQFPTPAIEGIPDACNLQWAAEMIVTVLRCQPETDDEHPPPVDAMERADFIQMSDMGAMQRGVQCALRGVKYRLGYHNPLPTGGLCGGSELQVFVAYGNCLLECAS